MQSTQPKIALMASANGSSQETKRIDWHSFLLSIASGGIIACAGFLFKINNDVTKLQEHDLQQTNYMNDNKLYINQIQLDMRDVRERTIRIEAQQKLDQSLSK
jgi:hypothetical protein